jgi:hypothetical protein
MNCVQAAITEYNQPDNVVDFCQHRDLDGILGELSPLCATLNITPETLRIAAQIIREAMLKGATKIDAYAAGMRYARSHQTAPTDEQVAACNALQAALWAKRRGEVA